MKRITMIVGLLLIGLLLSSSLWAGLTGAGAAEGVDGRGGVAPLAQITLVPFAPSVGPSQLATIAARLEADAVVIFDDLNMRSGPGLGFKVLGKYAVGTLLEVLGQERDSDNKPWLYVRTPDGKKGWMSARPSFSATNYLQINIPISDIPFVNPPKPTPLPVDGYVDVNDLNMRTGPGLGYSTIGKYDKGTPLDILGQKPDSQGMPWLYVQTPDGKKGYMSARPNLSTTRYVDINIPHSQIPSLDKPAADVEIDEVVLNKPVFTEFVPLGPKFWLFRAAVVSCSNVCKPIITPLSQLSGDEVCLEWYEMGTPDTNERIRIEVSRDGTTLKTGSILAEGDSRCRPIRLTLPGAGKYEVALSENRAEYDLSWTVD